MYFLRILCWLFLAVSATLSASPEEDRTLYLSYFNRLFPGVFLADFANGAYTLDKLKRDNWLVIEDFPPYDPFIDRGRQMWNTAFSDGNGYADCFDGNPAQRKNYPRWDSEKAEVVTLAVAVNDCRRTHGEESLGYGRGEMAALLAYMAYMSRGQVTQVRVPEDAPGALRAYEEGKSFYFRRRGQLNFACANCHMESAGRQLRSETISPALGQTSGWPTYWAYWGELGTLHRRFQVCNEQVRAKPFELQSPQYRNLEYFLTYLSNGVPFNGPSNR